MSTLAAQLNVDLRRFNEAMARIAGRQMNALANAVEATAPKETPMPDPRPLSLEHLIADLRTAEADEARASQSVNTTYDLMLGVIAGLDRIASDLAAGVLSPERVARAQGMAEGLAWCLRGHTGTLPEAES